MALEKIFYATLKRVVYYKLCKECSMDRISSEEL